MLNFHAIARLYIFAATIIWSSVASIHAHAVTRTWNSGGNGNFNVAANWSPNDAYPGASDTAEFNSGFVAYTVTFPGSFINPPPNYLIDKIVVRTNEVTFADNSSQFINRPSLTATNPDMSVVVGVETGEVAILNLTLRSFSGANASIGHRSSNDSDTLNVSSGTFSMSGEINVGVGGDGSLNVRNGGKVSSNILNVSDPSSSGGGTLLVESGGTVVSENAVLGLRSFTSSNTVTVTGAGSTWTVNQLLTASDWARMTIQDGGALFTDSADIAGAFLVSPAVTVTGTGSTWTNAGDLRIGVATSFGTPRSGVLRVLNGGRVNVGGQLLVEAGQAYGTYLGGNGTVAANITNANYVQPGRRDDGTSPYSPAAFHVEGSYLQTATGDLGIGITGTTPGTQHDQLKVNGSVSLNGKLEVYLLNSFKPSAGDVFDILDWSSLSGTFSSIQFYPLSPGLSWDTSRLYTDGLLRVVLPGDYNQNGTVDAADFVIWRKNVGTGNVLPNDPIGGTIGTPQYDQWRAHFGKTAGSGAGANANAAVPEPATLVLLILAPAGWYFHRRRTAEVVSTTHRA